MLDAATSSRRPWHLQAGVGYCRRPRVREPRSRSTTSGDGCPANSQQTRAAAQKQVFRCLITEPLSAFSPVDGWRKGDHVNSLVHSEFRRIGGHGLNCARLHTEKESPPKSNHRAVERKMVESDSRLSARLASTGSERLYSRSQLRPKYLEQLRL